MKLTCSIPESNEDEAPAPVVTPDSVRSGVGSTIQWDLMSCLLKENPRLMTSAVLISALQKRPSKGSVECMLSVNPKSAHVPNEGPTPLQIAVKYGCSCEVVSLLVKACPMALCQTNPGYDEDPLSYAKQHFRDNSELIELLKRPLGNWLEARVPEPLPENTDSVDLTQDGSPVLAITQTSIDQQDISNVKLLCARLIKGHKKLKQQLTSFQEQLHRPVCNRSEILREIEEQSKTNFRHQLIALDMKERAMRSHLKKVEQRCIKCCESRVEQSEKDMNTWRKQVDDNMKEWELILEQEAAMNEYVRNDIYEWVEEQSKRTTPFIGTNYCGEMKEDTCPARSRKLCGAWNRVHGN
eukprot:scaffold818_cov136-Cylindrotheca_fusiformis.AAC.12